MGFALTLIYVAFVFLRPQELHPEYAIYQVMDVLGVVALVGSVFSILTGGPKPLLRGPEWRFGLAFILWSAFSVAAAVHWFGGAYNTLLLLSTSLFTFVLIMLNVASRRRLVALLVVVWICVLALLAQAISAYYSDAEQSPFFILAKSRGSIDLMTDEGVGPPSPDDAAQDDDAPAQPIIVKRIKALGFLADPNDFAQALVCLIPLLWMAWRRHRPVRNVFLVLVPAAAAVWGVLLTRSRGGMVALASVVVVALIYRLGPRLRRPVGITALVMTAPAFVGLFGYARADASSASRLEAWATGFFTDHHDRVAHSSFVQCFAETGLMGYYLWLACLLVSLMRVSSLANSTDNAEWAPWARLLVLSMVGFLVAALFLSRTTSPMLFFVVSLQAVYTAVAEGSGQGVRLPRFWWATVLGLELLSVILVWMTARAYY
jgi:hypothetical protein